MKKLLIVMVLGASALVASAQGLQRRRTVGNRLAARAAAAKQQSEQTARRAECQAIENGERTEQVDGYTWTYRVNGDGVAICSVSPKPTGDVSIPRTLGGAIVTEIEDSVFRKCEGLTSVTIPEGVTSIGSSAFSGCSGLTSMMIPTGIINAVKWAFGRDRSWGASANLLSTTNGMTTVVFEKSCADKNVSVGCDGRSDGSLGLLRRQAERAEQRQQLLAIQEELQRVCEAKAAAAKSECGTACTADKPVSEKISVAEKLGQCDFLLNKDFKQKAKFYLCLFSASWCPPCRAEMPRIAKTYAETLKDDPDIELIHFSCDSDEEKAMAWAKEHDVKFPVVRPRGGNPLDLHCNGIPHLFIVNADGSLVEEGHPMRIFNEEKFRELK